MVITNTTFTLQHTIYGSVTLEFVVNKIKDYVTNYHNSINQKHDS